MHGISIFRYLHGRNYEGQLSSKIGCLEAGFHLNNSKLKRKLHA